MDSAAAEDEKDDGELLENEESEKERKGPMRWTWRHRLGAVVDAGCRDLRCVVFVSGRC